jgi:CspA family cold shock protein
MNSGTVKWFDEKRGLGFITPDDGGVEIFVHHSEIRGDISGFLRVGESVLFETEEDLKGPNATRVSRCETQISGTAK